MTYKGYTITAEVETSELWSVNEDGSLDDWITDQDYMGDPSYVIEDADGEYVATEMGFDEAKQRIDELVGQAEVAA